MKDGNTHTHTQSDYSKARKKERKEKKNRNEKKSTRQTDCHQAIKGCRGLAGRGRVTQVSRNIIRADTVEMTMEAPQYTKRQSVHICNPSTQEAGQEDVRLSSVMAT